MKLLMLVHHRFELWQEPGWFAPRLRRQFPDIEVVSRTNYEGAEKDLAEADVLMTWSLRPEQFRLGKKLRWVHSPAAAVHLLMSPELVASDVVVTNARDVHGPVVAEHALALMLALAKRLPSAMRYQQRHTWAQTELWSEKPSPREIAGATLAVVGLGSIGREVARRASALGLRVLAVREHREKGAESAEVFGPDDLDRVLAQADFVVLAAPLTPQTEGLINAARLAAMKRDAYLINVSRGPLVDEAALVEALRSGRIAGAALDVFEPEPLPADSPLWDVENLLITPHTAAVTERLWERHYDLLAENLRRYLAGEPLLGLVDKHRGY
jgi:phosphoglycerate dehydrogenase-like enzyme